MPAGTTLPALVIIHEACSSPDPRPYSEQQFLQYISAFNTHLPSDSFKFMDFRELCGNDASSKDIPKTILRAASVGRALIGSVPRNWCRALQTASHTALTPGPLVLWGCAEFDTEEVARGVARVAVELHWRDVLVLEPVLANEVLANERRSGMSWMVARELLHAGLAPRWLQLQQPVLLEHLLALAGAPPQVIVLCAWDESEADASHGVLRALRTARISSTILLISSRSIPGVRIIPNETDEINESRNCGTNASTDSHVLMFTPAVIDVQYTFERILHCLRSIDQRVPPFKSALYLYQWIEEVETGCDSRWSLVSELRNTTMMVRTAEQWGELLGRTMPQVGIDECECGEPRQANAWLATTTRALLPVLPVAMLAALLAALLAAVAFGIRYALTIAGSSKSPQSVLLAATEFLFPATADARRVDEGMEAMLSCWLQQLHEFGGPQAKAGAASPVPSQHGAEQRTRYKGEVVHAKFLNVEGGAFELRRAARDTLLMMQALRHENVNPFIGCLCEVRPALIAEYCSRGSLEDVLRADDIKLDWTFRLSLLTDLVRGMRYMHGSSLRVHGRLSSRNCVVDARWVLRVTDYGLTSFYRAQGLAPPPRSARDLLWTAPELLRSITAGGGESRGTQPGDVFSFSIVMQEVLVRGEPYCMLALSPEELVEKLKRPPPLIRPSVSIGAAPPEAVSVMRQCWSEQPELRPDFQHLLELFRQLHSGRKINIVDSMFEMLEKYSDNLEQLVKERTEQLDAEKRKTEQLLNRMLPSSVAARLVRGARVEPEEFEEVSVYFSDIVGFTALAARCSPVQVAHLLHDLYTAFDAAIQQYDVYKVETIGDAYMVVGGLPTRTADHAEQVATMALHLLHVSGGVRPSGVDGGDAEPLRLRAGLHSGPVCAAVVGLTMPRYCLFGDTVNTASRMESTGAAGRVQVSAATRDRLAAVGGYRLRYRGLTPVKGKGAMHTYWLLGKDGFHYAPPDPPPLTAEELLFETETSSMSDPLPPLTPTPVAHPANAVSDGLVQRSPFSSTNASTLGAAALVPNDYCKTMLCGGGYERTLRRQYSLEHADEPACDAAAVAPPRPRMKKQHSAGTEGQVAAATAAAAPATDERYKTRRARADTTLC